VGISVSGEDGRPRKGPAPTGICTFPARGKIETRPYEKVKVISLSRSQPFRMHTAWGGIVKSGANRPKERLKHTFSSKF
jgi:hypothetical protein